MKTPLNKALNFILEREGGLVNNPKDPGGITNHGISFRFLKQLHPELADIDGDGDVDADDIRALSQDDARTLYKAEFWDGLKLDLLPWRLAIFTMDTAVNMGKSRAVKIVQAALRGQGRIVVVDGLMGPATRAAIENVDLDILLRNVIAQRAWSYLSLCRRNAQLKAFLFGWLSRVEALEKAVAQHQIESMKEIKMTALTPVINAVVTEIVEEVLKTEHIQKFGDKLFDLIEDVVGDSETKIDDTLVLPVIKAARKALDIPDRADS